MKKCLIVLLTHINMIFVINIYGGEYQSKTIITANWGRGDGEFGLQLEAEGNCPQALAIDNEGNVAILDLVNKRIQLFSSEGKWLRKFTFTSRAFDVQCINDRFILLAPYDYLIEQYDREGKLIEKFNINPKIEMIDGLRTAGEKIFIQTVDQSQYDMSNKALLNQLQSLTRGFSTQIPDLRFQTRVIDTHHGHLLIENIKFGATQTITIDSQDELGSIVFLDMDKYVNIYLRKELFASDGKPYFEVDKMNKDGNLLSAIQIDNRNIVAPFKPVTVDRNGNVYFLEISSAGFSVIRWQEK